jgi:hypothetical protein
MAIMRASLSGIRVVVSDGAKVADDAMRLAYEGYVEAGFLAPCSTGRHFNAPYLNPGTRFIVTYAGDEAIATIAVVEDGPFGLPADRAFLEELDDLRAEGVSLSEASAFVIAPRWRRQIRLVLGYVLGTVVRLSLARPAGNRVVFTVEPRQADIYRSIFCGSHTIGPRPLLHAPGTLVITEDVAFVRTFLADTNGSAIRAIVAEHALSPDPDWLEYHEPSGGWRQEVLPPLLAESGLENRVRQQMEILRASQALAGFGPDLLSGVAPRRYH